MLELVRDLHTPHTSIGKMFLESTLLCDTLEDMDREGDDGILQPSEKVYGKTCIPIGMFEVVLLYWAKYGCKMPHIIGVPLFTELFIHPGNKEDDTLGCVLTGQRTGQPDYIINSRTTFFEKVLPKIHDWLDDHDKLPLRVRNA